MFQKVSDDILSGYASIDSVSSSLGSHESLTGRLWVVACRGAKDRCQTRHKHAKSISVSVTPTLTSIHILTGVWMTLGSPLADRTTMVAAMDRINVLLFHMQSIKEVGL